MSQSDDVSYGVISDDSIVAKPTSSKARKPTSKPSKTKTFSKSNASDPEIAEDSFDLVLPPFVGTANNGTCTVMVEVDSEDAALLDYEGVSGAIGRLQADDRGVILDLKGCQYHASILPGPTALVVGLAKGNQLRVDCMTDEFATMVKTQDIMAKLDGVVEGEMDESFQHRDENVNTGTGQEESSEVNSGTTKTAGSAAANKQPSAPTKKRGAERSQTRIKRRKTKA